MTRLTTLQVKALRGIVQSELLFEGGSIVLGGGNGTGKTAWVDAIEFLYTGSISTLVGTAGLSLRQHGAHILQGPQESRVTARYQDPAGEITRWLRGTVDSPAALDRHLARGAALTFILRRSQLQQFIHAKPADRYRSMADLVGAENLERAELTLKRARDTIQSGVLALHAGIEQVERQLAALPDEEMNGSDILRETNEQLAALGFSDATLAAFDDVPRVRTAILRRARRHETDPAAISRARFREDLDRGIGQRGLRDVMSAYLALARGGSQNRDSNTLELLQILRRGREYLSHTRVGRCPLCEQHVDSQALLKQMIERVGQLEEVSLRQQQLEHAREDLEAAIQDTAARLRSIDALQRASGVPGSAASRVENPLAMLRESVRDGALTESMDMVQRLENGLTRWEEWRLETLAAVEDPLTDTDDDEQAQAVNAAIAVLEAATTHNAQLLRAQAERDRLIADRTRLGDELRPKQRALALAERAYTTFNRVKNDEIQRIYDQLQADLVRMYDLLHPGEGHRALSIIMDPRKRGSSELKMGFHERDDEDPRAFSSEGHLDSLGLCIFLAFVKRFNGDWPLLVLDDVVPAVDAAHKLRVARLLFEEFGDRQLFITTHDSRWFLDLHRVGAEAGREDVRYLVIQSWSLEDGPRIREDAVAPASSHGS